MRREVLVQRTQVAQVQPPVQRGDAGRALAPCQRVVHAIRVEMQDVEFVRALEERGVALDPHLVAANQQTVDQAREATRALLRVDNPPTAIFCANNRNAIGALKEISAQLNAGSGAVRDFPEIMSFDDFELAELSPVPISVIDHDPRELGRTATRLLLDRLDGGKLDAPVREIELPVSLRGVR